MPETERAWYPVTEPVRDDRLCSSLQRTAGRRHEKRTRCPHLATHMMSHEAGMCGSACAIMATRFIATNAAGAWRAHGHVP